VLLASLLPLLLLAACGVTEQDAAAYVRGELAACYLGQSQEAYLKLTGFTSAEVARLYQENTAAEAERLLAYLTEGPAAEDAGLRARAEELVCGLYAAAACTVGEAVSQEEGGFTVPVTIRPVELRTALGDDVLRRLFRTACEETGITGEEQIALLDQESYQELERAYVRLALEHLASAELKLGPEQTAELHLEESRGNLAVTAESWAALDALMIDYGGRSRTEN